MTVWYAVICTKLAVFTEKKTSPCVSIHTVVRNETQGDVFDQNNFS